MRRRNIHLGSHLDEFLREEGVLAEVGARALKRAIALRLHDLMTEEKITKSKMAQRMLTSRAAVDRLLDGGNTSVTLGTLHKAAKAVGKKLKIDWVPA